MRVVDPGWVTPVPDQVLQQVFNSTQAIAAVGDFDGDGTPDLFWRDSATGTTAVWLIKNGAVTQTLNSTPEPNLSWTIVDSGRYGNGTADGLVWRNTATGENRIWSLDPTTLQNMQTSPMATLADQTWVIVK